MKRWLREPLLHFLVLGASFFLIDAALRDRGASAGGGEIVVTAGRIENLAALFARTWQRAPTQQELRGLVDEYVLEEALYREGMALGVAEDDTIIRRRVRQKIEFIVNDIADPAVPGDEVLTAWLADHAASYALPARSNFRQVYLSPDRRGDTLLSDAAGILAELRASADTRDPRGLGDPSLLEPAYGDIGADTIARSFGQGFADSISLVPVGEWSGPVESPFGLHVVIVDARTEARVPALDEVRDEVVRDWSHARREAASKAFQAEVVARYRVSIEWPQDGAPR